MIISLAHYKMFSHFSTSNKSQFLIGATSSGCGKTTLTIGLLRAIRKRGLQVQPFKCGPDYLDPKHHAIAAGRNAINLDSFLASAGHIKSLYSYYGQQADVCVTEGVMGLFDGYKDMQGSSAEIAGILDQPVILIINARSSAYSVAPILYGFKHFQPHIRIVGAIFNFVSSPTHYDYLRQACQDTGVEALGYLRKCQSIEIPSRHLGLSIDTEFCLDEFAEQVATEVEKTIDIQRLLEVTSQPFPQPAEESTEAISPASGLRISIAQDEAFNFIYAENIRSLKKLGQVTFFSPLQDTQLPPSDFVYLPGGYPEFYLQRLSANQEMRQSLLAYCQSGGHLLAECGGMMYLGEFIADAEGKKYPMCQYLPQAATMENMKLKLGYRKVICNGQEWRGHEFHYSRIVAGSVPSLPRTQVYNAQGTKVDTPIYSLNRTIASYIHFYWGEKTDFISMITGRT